MEYHIALEFVAISTRLKLIMCKNKIVNSIAICIEGNKSCNVVMENGNVVWLFEF